MLVCVATLKNPPSSPSSPSAASLVSQNRDKPKGTSPRTHATNCERHVEPCHRGPQLLSNHRLLNRCKIATAQSIT